jgi:hypothetical protein
LPIVSRNAKALAAMTVSMSLRKASPSSVRIGNFHGHTAVHPPHA